MSVRHGTVEERTSGMHAVDASCDGIVEEFEGLIDRHFAAHRTLIVERENSKFWIAHFPDRDDPLYRSPDGNATLRFARTFAERTPGVTVAVQPALHGFSVRVPVLDNVVPILGRVEA